MLRMNILTMVLILDGSSEHTVRTCGVNQAFQFAEGIWLHRNSRQIRFIFGKDVFYFIRAHTCSELPS